MPAARNAQYLCDRTRDLLGMWDRTELSDGFAEDASDADTSILPWLNKAIGDVLTGGLVKCRFYEPMIAGQSEYTLNPAIGLIDAVWFGSVPMEKTSIAHLNRNRRSGWLSASPVSVPPFWYNDISNVIGIWPPPLTSDDPASPSLQILAETLSQDLVSAGDVPDRVPYQFHDDLAVGAAYWILLGQIGSGDTDAGTDPASPGEDGLASTDPNLVLAKFGAIKSLWGTPTDATDVGTVLSRVRRFAQQRDLSETVQIAPPPRRGGRWGGGGVGLRY